MALQVNRELASHDPQPDSPMTLSERRTAFVVSVVVAAGVAGVTAWCLLYPENHLYEVFWWLFMPATIGYMLAGGVHAGYEPVKLTSAIVIEGGAGYAACSSSFQRTRGCELVCVRGDDLRSRAPIDSSSHQRCAKAIAAALSLGGPGSRMAANVSVSPLCS